MIHVLLSVRLVVVHRSDAAFRNTNWRERVVQLPGCSHFWLSLFFFHKCHRVFAEQMLQLGVAVRLADWPMPAPTRAEVEEADAGRQGFSGGRLFFG